jgi:hypothetical protein
MRAVTENDRAPVVDELDPDERFDPSSRGRPGTTRPARIPGSSSRRTAPRPSLHAFRRNERRAILANYGAGLSFIDHHLGRSSTRWTAPTSGRRRRSLCLCTDPGLHLGESDCRPPP